jgi:hypothetical protein
MSLTSSILNPITFKDLTAGSYPNTWNTLHEDHYHGFFKIIPYRQLFPTDTTVYLQFSSDLITVPVLKAYKSEDGLALVATIVGSLASTIGTDDIKYFFNFAITLNSTYAEKSIYFICTQGTDVLTSEPIYVDNYSDQIARGQILMIKYTNYDRGETDLNTYFIDWANLDSDGKYLLFFIEGNMKEMQDSDEVEILEGSQSNEIISSVYFAGVQLKTGIIPDYMSRKLKAASSLDCFTVNEVEYVKEGGADDQIVGQSTSVQTTLKLTEKNTLGINVDDLGIENFAEMEWTKYYETDSAVSDFNCEIPEGYYLHTIRVTHAAASSGNDATVTAGYSLGAGELIDSFAGVIPDDGNIHSFPIHQQSSFDSAGTLYVGVSGAGVVLRFRIDFNLSEEI